MRHENTPIPHSDSVQEDSKRRLLREATAGTALNLTASAILPSLAAGTIDVLGLCTFILEGPRMRGKVKKLVRQQENTNPTVRFPKLRMGFKNIYKNEEEMSDELQKWSKKETENLNREINLSSRREKTTAVRSVVFPTILGLGRVGLQVIGEVPHQSDGIGGFFESVHGIINNVGALPIAWESFTQHLVSLPTAITAAVIASTFWSLRLSANMQKEMTEILVKRKESIPETQVYYMTHYDDLKRGFLERTVDKTRSVVTNVLQRK